MSSEPTTNITSAQILGDAAISHVTKFERPQQSIQDLDELLSYQVTKRREYEQQLNKNRLNFGQWLRYAKWEVEQNIDFERARSIYERALDVNVEHIPFWVQYIQFELLHKNVNHARNLLDRATTILPRVGKLWFLYVRTEEALKNYAAVRDIFERWMRWHPDLLAWDAYVSFEIRYNELAHAREIFDRYVVEFPNTVSWMKYIDFEMKDQVRGKVSDPTSSQRMRQVFEMAVDTLIAGGNIQSDTEFPDLIKRWANWEVAQRENARARLIYTMLMDKENSIPLSRQQNLAIKKIHIEFNKLYGDKDGVTGAISIKRAAQYEEQLRLEPRDYDVWWALLNLYDTSRDPQLSDTFKQAMLQVPLETHKSSNWRKYVMIGYRFALWLEYNELNIPAARDAWDSLRGLIPTTSVTFAKVWIGLAEFELRNTPESEDGLKRARKLLGRGIGISAAQGPKGKIFKYYIRLETRLGEWNRVRKLYERWIELSLTTSNALLKSSCAMDIFLEWISFEKGLGEYERCVALYEVGIQLYSVKQLTARFKGSIARFCESYVDFYVADMAYSEARAVHVALTEQIDTPQVWISYAIFESSIPSHDQLARFNASEAAETEFEFEIEDDHRRETRRVFEQALAHFDATESGEYKLQILESWRAYEKANGDRNSRDYVDKKFPILVRKRKTIQGVEQEYLEYEFPQDSATQSTSAPGLNTFLANAKKWALENSKESS